MIRLARGVQRLRQRKQEAAELDACEHDWVTERKLIRPERTDWQVQNGQEYRHGPAYLKVRRCNKCEIEKPIRLNVTVERR